LTGHYVSYLIPAKAAMSMADLPTIDAKGFIAAPQKPGLG
jgi:hypothetical protein